MQPISFNTNPLTRNMLDGHVAQSQAMEAMAGQMNGLGQAAALATLSDLGYYRKQFERIIALRDSTTRELTALGFDVLPSQTNFIFAKPSGITAGEWFIELRNRNILTRWFDKSGIRDRLRITIGTEKEMERFLTATRAILRNAE